MCVTTILRGDSDTGFAHGDCLQGLVLPGLEKVTAFPPFYA